MTSRRSSRRTTVCDSFPLGTGRRSPSHRGGAEQIPIPVDGRRDRLGGTAIDWLGDIRRVLVEDLPAKHVLFIADACYSGYGAKRDLGVVPVGGGPPLSRVGALTARQVLTAGGKGERVVEEGGQGLFTRILLRGLEGAADRNGDGAVTASELANYVREHVPAASGYRQTPNFRTPDMRT